MLNMKGLVMPNGRFQAMYYKIRIIDALLRSSL